MRVTKSDVRGAYRYYGLFYAEEKVISKEYVLKSDDGKGEVLCYDFAEKAWKNVRRASFERLLAAGRLDEMQETDAIWFLEIEKAFNGEGDDAAVAELLKKWSEKKEEFREEFDYGWPAKYVETRFYLKGKAYSITPDDIGLEKGDCWDEGFMEFLQSDIGKDLKELGAEEIRHLGFLD